MATGAFPRGEAMSYTACVADGGPAGPVAGERYERRELDKHDQHDQHDQHADQDEEQEAAAGLVRRAAAGDQLAWEQLVDQYARLVFAVTRSFRLSDSDASDVSQTAWLRLLEHIDRIDPGR